ncbi:hypothetical protein CAOG_005845 [Capsaspora owczarzaki ATCC 30864]|uniref:CAP-Gly domain-containing protein n=1 Tax=Capsaspora owczarzaki (strain ATCC 30864) TaxID=595528 RepID=A0A0D2UJW3_CAPO3|nr:hypothetical protein CAOG_005845 [Capsaspora owczarzaki ATCC 30864]
MSELALGRRVFVADQPSSAAAQSSASAPAQAPVPVPSIISSGGVSGALGTVRFVGLVPPSEGEWFGIEWDDPSRGKHDGSHGGHTYFHCRHPMAGSFVRPKRVNFGVPFTSALREKYAVPDASAAVVSDPTGRVVLLKDDKDSLVKVQLVGLDAVEARQRQLHLLPRASLRDCLVNGQPDTDPIDTKSLELDLSRNLLSSWVSAAEVASRLPRLTFLDLSDNLLSWDTLATVKLPLLQSLFLNNSGLAWAHFSSVGVAAPNLLELHARSNHLSSPAVSEVQDLAVAFPHLEHLDLDANEISSWDSIQPVLGHISNLKRLILSRNKLVDISPLQDTSLFPSLSALSLLGCPIDKWSSVNALGSLQKLSELRFSDVPLVKDFSVVDARLILIAKLRGLTFCNGSDITPRERDDAERFYLARFASDWVVAGREPGDARVAFDREHPRFNALIAIHGAPSVPSASATSSALKHTLIELNLTHGSRSQLKKLPRNLSIAKLRMMVAKLFAIPSSSASAIRIASVDPTRHISIPLDDDFRELDFYSLEPGSTLLVTVD